MNRQSRLCLEFPSEVRHVDLVHTVSDRVSDLLGLDENETLNLGLAVREATINAIKHGNRMDASKKVSVTFEFDPGGIVVSITDRGNGFDPHETPDPRLPENIHRTNGRGILLMRAFVDRIEVEQNGDGGNLVRLVKTLDPGRTDGGAERA